jgi:hypothetical protein
MSVKALSAVWEDSRAIGADLLVLLAMADWADHSGRCFPSYGQIALKARVSRATVANAVRRLVGLGELERVTHGHMPTDSQDDEVARSVERQWRNAYRILLVKPKGQVGQPVDYLSSRQVAQPVDHLSPPAAERGSPIQTPPGGLIQTPEVVQSADPHIRKNRQVNRQDEPSEELRAGPAARRPIADDDDPNVRVILKTAHDAIDLEGEDASLADLADAVKTLCHIRHLNVGTTSELISKAVDAALWQRAHARRPEAS